MCLCTMSGVIPNERVSILIMQGAGWSYAAAAQLILYFSMTHVVVTSWYAFPEMFTNLKFHFMFVVIPAE